MNIERKPWRYLVDIYVYFQLCFRIWNSYLYSGNWASQAVLVVKNLPTPCRRPKLDAGSVPGWGESPGEGNGYPLQYSCLGIPWAEEPGGLWSIGLQRWTGLKNLAFIITKHFLTLLISHDCPPQLSGYVNGLKIEVHTVDCQDDTFT